MSTRLLKLGLGLALLVGVLDQATKVWASADLTTGPIILIPGFFDLTLVHNRGVAFGMLGDIDSFWRDAFLIGVAAIASVVIVIMLKKSASLLEGAALGLVLGGAVGNLIDRLRLGWVVDFIHVHWHDLSWPVFNVADSAITVGIGILLIDNLRSSPSSDHDHQAL